MSLVALTWAWQQSPSAEGVSDTALKFVLVAVADVANEQWHAYPSVERLMSMTGLGDQAVRRALAALAAAGYMVDTGERRGATGRVRVWQLVGGTVVVGPNQSGDHHRIESGDLDSQSGDLDRPYKEDPSGPTTETPAPPIPPAPSSLAVPTVAAFNAAFLRFWEAYPRHDDRPRAERAFAKAIKRVPLEVIVAGAERYAADPNREPKYTKQPASWLNADAWDNDPVPADRNGSRSSAPSDRRMAEIRQFLGQTGGEHDGRTGTPALRGGD